MTVPPPAPHPAVPAPADRLRAMDRARGVVVMGILLMNAIAFAMPEVAYFNPAAWGGTDGADLAMWGVTFILVDGKMRGLFALLFGASMLLLMERTEMSGGDGRLRHAVRSGWLLLFGVAHYLLLWWGDILALYAVVGLLALPFANRAPLALVKLAFLAFALHFLTLILIVLGLHHIEGVATAPGATPDQMASFAQLLDSVGRPGSAAIAREIALYRGPWSAMVAEKAAHLSEWAVNGLRYSLFDTLGFMLLGMAMLKGGFLSGRWPRAQYLAVARHGFTIGLPPMVALAAWAWASGFAPLRTFDIAFAWSFPFRIPLTVAVSALVFAFVAGPGAETGPLGRRLEAVGRLSLSNYLGTSLIMTALFYGWGLGWFGHVSRVQAYFPVPFVWALMLLWSLPWINRFRHGPAEWLWRSLTTLRLQPLRRSPPQGTGLRP